MKNKPFLSRLGFACAGLAAALRAENSFRVHVLAVLVVAVALAVLQPAPVWWAMVLLAAGMVMAAELLNTAIEHLADHLHPEQHAAIRIVKDCAAAGVLIASAAAVAVAVAMLVDLFG